MKQHRDRPPRHSPHPTRSHPKPDEARSPEELAGNAAAVSWMGNDPDLREGRDIPRQDMIYEHLAHRMGYGPVSGGNRHMLSAWGYGEPEVIEGANGFAMTLFRVADTVPKTAEQPLRPVVVFRGTEPTQLADLGADLNPAGVGARQVMANHLEIIEALRLLAGDGGKVDLAGHSLGGAIAQLVACLHPELVGRVVGFQSPGVPSNLAHNVVSHNETARKRGEHEVETTYHLVENDLVHRAGQSRLPGKTYTHDTDASNPLSAHTGLILAGGGAYRLNDIDRVAHPDGVSQNRHGRWTEPLRAGAGWVLGQGGQEQDIERWFVVQRLLKGGHYLLDEIREPGNRARTEAAWPELAAADRALKKGDDAAVKAVLSDPPRALSSADRLRLETYIETWCTRHRRPSPLRRPDS